MKNSNFRVTEDLYASHSIRLANYVIDRIVLQLLLYGFGVFIGTLIFIFSDTPEEDFIMYENMNPILNIVFNLVLLIFFYFLLEGLLKGRTIGKYMTETRVVNEFGEVPSTDQILIRSLCRFIPFNVFSFFGHEARGWHDTISKTYVVDVKMLKRRKETGSELDLIGHTDE